MTSKEDDLNGRQTRWKMTSMEDNLNGRQPQWKKTLMETASRKEVLREEDLNGSQPLWKPYRKHTTLAGLDSQFCTELGPAQPPACYLLLHR